tara:strand:- start:1118 stop:1381 length:264 start_codon:yes stop_codon:yes gene_type:complete
MRKYTLEHQQTTSKQGYGSVNVYSEFILRTFTEGMLNRYEVNYKVMGLESGSPYLDIVKCFALDDNYETLTIDGVTDIIEDNDLINQ